MEIVVKFKDKNHIPGNACFNWILLLGPFHYLLCVKLSPLKIINAIIVKLPASRYQNDPTNHNASGHLCEEQFSSP